MSSLGVLRGHREHRQRPSPASEHRELRRAHLPHALVTRTPMWRQRAGTRRLGSGDAVLIPILVALPSANFSGMGSTRSCHCRDASRSEVGRDQVARLMAMSGIPGDERRRGVTTDAVVPTSPPTSFTGSFSRNVRTPAESRTGPRPHHRRDGRRLSPRRHEVQDRRLAGRLGDDGPDGPPGPRGGPAPPGCVPRRSLVLPRSGPLRCRE